MEQNYTAGGILSKRIETPSDGERLLDLRRNRPGTVMLIPKSGLETRFQNTALQAFGIHSIGGSGGGDHVLLDHDRAQVIGPSVEGQLGHLRTYGEPEAWMLGMFGSISRLRASTRRYSSAVTRLRTPRARARRVPSS
jgi:hypothetical protein